MPESFVGRKYVFIILSYLAIARRTCRRETKKGTLKITAAANVGVAALDLGEYEVDQANSERQQAQSTLRSGKMNSAYLIGIIPHRIGARGTFMFARSTKPMCEGFKEHSMGQLRPSQPCNGH
jgi:hypothetical protein